jgi:hypothetical protein
MIHAGGGRDEYPVKARELNQTHVDSNFGINYGGSVIYGKLGAARAYPTHVMISLANVSADEIRLELDQELFFTHHQHEKQVEQLLSTIGESTA